VKPHARMERLIAGAVTAVHPALTATLVNDDGSIDLDALQLSTVRVERLQRTPRGPASAVYITWDTHGRCRYVGSVCRPGSRSAVRARMEEHLQRTERRGAWYAVTVLPVRLSLRVEVVRACEGIVARRLCPIEGTSHPVPSTERSLLELVDPRIARIAS